MSYFCLLPILKVLLEHVLQYLFECVFSVLFSIYLRVELCVSVCAHAQRCLTLCTPVDCSPPGSSVCEIFQVRILKWVAISFFRGSSQPRDWTHVSWVSCIFRQIQVQEWNCWVIILCLTSWGTAKLFSIAAELFSIPTITFLCFCIFIFKFSLRLHLLNEIHWSPCWSCNLLLSPLWPCYPSFPPFLYLHISITWYLLLGTCSIVSLYLVLPLIHRNSYSFLNHRTCSTQQSFRHLSLHGYAELVLEKEYCTC